MFFKDRKSAGQQLVKSLEEYRDAKECIIIALPRGGVITAFEIAKALKLPLDIITPRKIRAPFNPEFAIGAVTETDVGYLNRDLVESFISHLAASAKEDRAGLICKLNSFAPVEVPR